MAPEERRDDLLDTALRLCATVGYEPLAVDQITKEAGVAKGTFYNYFRTKQDMLIALVERFADELFANLDALAATLEGTGEQRLHTLLLAAANWKTERLDDAMAFVPLLYKPENLELRHRLFDAWTARTRELFFPLVERGAADGTFDVDDPETATDLMLSIWVDGSSRMYGRALACDSREAFADIVFRGVAGLGKGVERILGATPGTMQAPVERATVEALYGPFRAALNEPSPGAPS